jgi:hypothetical protein
VDEQLEHQQLRLDREPETHSYVYRVQDGPPDISLGLYVGEVAHRRLNYILVRVRCAGSFPLNGNALRSVTEGRL